MLGLNLMGILLTGFAAYRIAQLITEDTGPMSVFANLRRWADDQAVKGRLHNFNEGIHCPYCVGIWAALGCALLLVYTTWLGHLFLLVFGLAGIQAFLQGLRQ